MSIASNSMQTVDVASLAVTCHTMSVADHNLTATQQVCRFLYGFIAWYLLCREADASIDAAGFQPASAGTLFAYQFTPGQKNALYPQLASATPFTATDTELLAIVDNSDPAKGPVFQPPKNDYAKTYEFGAKKSAKRKQYDTGWYVYMLTLSRMVATIIFPTSAYLGPGTMGTQSRTCMFNWQVKQAPR